MADDDFKPATRDDVNDMGLVPRRLDIIARDLRSLYSLIEQTVVPGIRAIGVQIEQLDREDGKQSARIGALEAEVSELRAMIAVSR